jgi:hypothetical protein
MRPALPPSWTPLSVWSLLSERERSRRAVERYALNQGLAEAGRARRSALRARPQPPARLDSGKRRHAARLLLSISRRVDVHYTPEASEAGSAPRDTEPCLTGVHRSTPRRNHSGPSGSVSG